MKNVKNKVVASLAVLGLVAGTFGLTAAYFTDSDNTTNKFEIGSIETELHEPEWDKSVNEDGELENVIPSKAYAKDPQIENVGENNAWVYLEVKIPYATVETTEEDGTVVDAEEIELFTMETVDPSMWTQLSHERGDDGFYTYVFGYNNAIAPGETTEPLFENIRFANLTEDQTFDTDTFENSVLDVPVKSMAIQEEETGTMQEAYAKYVTQNN